MPNISELTDPKAMVREIMRRDFVSFFIRGFPEINGGSDADMSWHIEAIAYQLERIEAGSCQRSIIEAPPRSAKSMMVSVIWVAWCLGQDPALEFLCVSYSNELAAKHARDCKAIMQSKWYRELFPATVISPARTATHDFDTTAGGGRIATSTGGTVTGRGGDIIIVDDPIKPAEAMSDTTRNNVNDWFLTTLLSRLNDKTKGVFIVVMQRLHQHDLAGMLRETGEWDVLSLPAIAPEDKAIPLTRSRVHQRKEGEVLHPSREPYETLMKVKRDVGSVIFSAQYQQEPVAAEGNIVHSRWLGVYRQVPSGGTIVQSWDTASKDGIFNDFSVCITVKVLHKEVYVLDVFRKRLQFPDLKRAAITLAREFKASVMLIEDQATGTSLLQTLRQDRLT